VTGPSGQSDTQLGAKGGLATWAGDKGDGRQRGSDGGAGGARLGGAKRRDS
jgi:hypothetical protein